jgi:hypothetical protein
MLWVLIPKKDTTVAVIPRIERAANPKRDLYIPGRKTLDQGDVVRTSYFGLIVADPFVEPERAIALLVDQIPSPLIGELPTGTALLKVLLEKNLTGSLPSFDSGSLPIGSVPIHRDRYQKTKSR